MNEFRSSALGGPHDRPLSGIRVVDVGIWHAGPGASAILGDLGAEVIKVETLEGDPERYYSNFNAMTDTTSIDTDEWSVMFDMSNRNKKGICVDLRQPKGREVLHRLIARADVFMTNLRSETKPKFGIDYETLSRVNPRIVHVNITGFGRHGALRDAGALDTLGQAFSGMMFMGGPAEPAPAFLAILDQFTSITASHAAITGLLARELHGIGQEIHASLYGAGTWLQHANLLYTSVRDKEIDCTWDRTQASPLLTTYRCQDDKWVFGAIHPEETYWAKFCAAIGREDLLTDPRFLTKEDRLSSRQALVAECDSTFAEKPRDEWLAIFRSCGLLLSPIQTYQEVLRDPQARENGYITDFHHRIMGDVTLPGYPIEFSKQKAGMHAAAPGLGEHTREVLQELGYTEADIKEMQEQGNIAIAPVARQAKPA